MKKKMRTGGSFHRDGVGKSGCHIAVYPLSVLSLNQVFGRLPPSLSYDPFTSGDFPQALTFPVGSGSLPFS